MQIELVENIIGPERIVLKWGQGDTMGYDRKKELFHEQDKSSKLEYHYDEWLFQMNTFNVFLNLLIKEMLLTSSGRSFHSFIPL